MDRYLLTMFTDQPRRFRVIENIVRNKRTQANLFWGLNYQLLNWSGSNNQLSRQEFDQWLGSQQRAGSLMIKGNYAWLTNVGMQLKQSCLQSMYQPHNSQWSWLINQQKFADRFLLGVQAASELAHRHRHYVPLNISPTEMVTVRKWLANPQITNQLEIELQMIGQNLARQDNRLAEFFAHRLIGYRTTGWTNQQAQLTLKLSAEEIQILNWDVWLGVAGYLKMHSQCNLYRLMESLISQVPISNSAWQTLQDFQEEVTIQAIARRCHLKVSTVREHLLEAAIIVPQAIDWDRLLPWAIEQQLRDRYSGPVAEWHFKSVTTDSAAEFFSFRLYQIKELQQIHGAI